LLKYFITIKKQFVKSIVEDCSFFSKLKYTFQSESTLELMDSPKNQSITL